MPLTLTPLNTIINTQHNAVSLTEEKEMSYRLSYVVNTDLVEVFVDSEIELAEAILDMERDVGKICYAVKIEQHELPEDYQRQDTLTVLQNIQHYSTILAKDLKRKVTI